MYIIIFMNDEEIQKEEIVDLDKEEFEDDVSFIESTEDGDVLPTKDIVKKLREENKKIRIERDEYLTLSQRVRADYVNLQKEEEGKRKDLKNFIVANFIEDLLPSMDSFDMAMSNKEAWEKVDSSWRSGIEYIYSQFLKSFENNSVTPINTVGVPFDAKFHEAIENIETTNKEEDHLVSNIVQSGYKILDSNKNDKVIRPARVKVYKFND